RSKTLGCASSLSPNRSIDREMLISLSRSLTEPNPRGGRNPENADWGGGDQKRVASAPNTAVRQSVADKPYPVWRTWHRCCQPELPPQRYQRDLPRQLQPAISDDSANRRAPVCQQIPVDYHKTQFW